MKISGKVIDWGFDCGHLVVWKDGDHDILHDALKKVEGKTVEIVIKVCDDS